MIYTLVEAMKELAGTMQRMGREVDSLLPGNTVKLKKCIVQYEMCMHV